MAAAATLRLRGWRTFIPVITTTVMAMLMLLPIGTGADGVAMPHLVMISVFYWLSHRPLLLPYGACASIGLLLDLWLGVPLGLNIVLLVLTRTFVLNQLKHYRGRSRFLYWMVFALMAFGLYALSWLLVSLAAWEMMPLKPLGFQWLLTSFAYAPLVLILGRFRSSMV